MFKKIYKIFLNIIPIILMIILIPFVQNDYTLTGIYILIITISLMVKYEKRDAIFLVFGFFIMIIAEYFFISTGVEEFIRNSLFGIMPLWLPFLWAYAFIAMKRSIIIMNKD